MGRWIVPAALGLLGLLLAGKGAALWGMGTEIDGEGIGIRFLGWEINDRVPKVEIPVYATRFWMSGLIFLFISLVLGIYTRTRYRGKQT